MAHINAYNTHIERVRNSEYPQLKNTTYLDHAGTTLYARSLIDAYHQDLISHLYGNPHSVSPASDLSTQVVDGARLAVLNYFQADPEYFDVVFTANATASIKLVADCFRDQDFDYAYHKDVHTSVVGVREIAKSAQCLATHDQVQSWLQKPSSRLQLFAYPAQSNLNGYRLPYSWCKRGRNANTYVLLDAASYLTSGRLDLSSVSDAPDFIAMSFYKIFGFPDLGALIVKKTAFDVMTPRKYFGGGTVDSVTVIGGSFHGTKRSTIHDFLEDGTLPFHNILALKHAIAVHERIYGSAKDISRHVAHLIAWLHDELKILRHYNGTPVVDIYKDPRAVYGDPTTQGPIIAFNLLASDGTPIGKSHFERLAINCGFQIRTGGVCNPGGISSMLGLCHWEMMRNFTEGVRCGGDVDIMGSKPTGVCRVSLGPMSTTSDVERFANFVKYFFVEEAANYQIACQRVTAQNRRPKIITPIHGCAGFSVRAADFPAYESWENQWCIVDKLGDIVQPQFIRDLSVTIDVKSEQLRFTHTSGSTTSISLWDVPPKLTTPQNDEELFDIYNESPINTWLSTYLNIPCTLARYRDDPATEKGQTTSCIVSDCAAIFYTKQIIPDHYHIHASEFMRTYPFAAPNSSTTNITPAPIATTTPSHRKNSSAPLLTTITTTTTQHRPSTHSTHTHTPTQPKKSVHSPATMYTTDKVLDLSTATYKPNQATLVSAIEVRPLTKSSTLGSKVNLLDTHGQGQTVDGYHRMPIRQKESGDVPGTRRSKFSGMVRRYMG